MTVARRVSERLWERRLLGHVKFLAENALAPNLFRDLADRFAEEQPILFAFLSYDRRMKLLPEVGLRDVVRHDMEPYFQYFAPLNPFTKVMKRDRLLDATVVLSHHLSVEELLKTEYWDGFMRPRGEKYALSMSLRSSRFGRASLTFYRGDKTGGDFDEEDVRRFDALRPFVRNALILRALVRERGSQGRGLESLRDPALLLSKRGVRPLNEAGEVYLCARCKAEIPNPNEERFRDGKVEFVPVESSTAKGVVVTVPGQAESESPVDRLRRRFGLTRTEAAVAQGLLDGLSYREIGDEFDITSETVHTHVKAIHRKADVSTTGQFVARCLSGR
jgi:DNA-binding CsgD family transcriptional regulator/uncharacterized protein YlaI